MKWLPHLRELIFCLLSKCYLMAC